MVYCQFIDILSVRCVESGTDLRKVLNTDCMSALKVAKVQFTCAM